MTQGLSAPFFVALFLSGAVPIAAQSTGTPVSCTGQFISTVEVVTRAPYEGNGNRLATAPLRFANQLHVTTEQRVVANYLLLRPGEPCTERLRSESERLLRAQPYLADARVRAFDDGMGGVMLRVITVDELTSIVSVRAEADAPWVTGLTLGEGNLLGQGMLVSASWREGSYRPHWEARLTHYQFLSRPHILNLLVARRDVGFNEWALGVSHPYFTDLQRFAWQASIASRNEVFDFHRGDAEPVGLSLASEHATLGGVVRVGSPGRLSLFGLAITNERSRTGPPPPERRLPGVDYLALAEPFGGRRTARFNVLWGLRSLDYVRVQRFDALNAVQDAARGFQLGVVLGRSLGVLATHDDDMLVATDLYLGRGGERSFISLHARGEARDNFDVRDWDGILASATLAARHRVHPRHTMLFEANWSAGWRQQVPFQLPLGSRHGGVRGFIDAREAGGRRAVVSVEDRWYLGAVRGQADLGVAAFVDAGAVRAGDAPLGVRSPVRLGVGVGMLAAVPAGSRRTWRLDLAVPVNPDGYAKWEVRLGTSTSILALGWREPPEVTRSREQAVPIGLFSWP